MEALNGEEDGPDPLQELIEDFMERTDRILRLLAATPYVGHIIVPSEFPLPPQSISPN